MTDDGSVPYLTTAGPACLPAAGTGDARRPGARMVWPSWRARRARATELPWYGCVVQIFPERVVPSRSAEGSRRIPWGLSRRPRRELGRGTRRCPRVRGGGVPGGWPARGSRRSRPSSRRGAGTGHTARRCAATVDDGSDRRVGPTCARYLASTVVGRIRSRSALVCQGPTGGRWPRVRGRSPGPATAGTAALRHVGTVRPAVTAPVRRTWPLRRGAGRRSDG
jgi:hypothetical protein